MEHNYQGLDTQASLRSLGPRAVAFDFEQSSSELGPQVNVGNEIRPKIIHKEFRGGELIAIPRRVCSGYFNQKRATIIVIQILLHAPKIDHQLRHLEVEISFEPRSNRSTGHVNVDSYPIVRNVAPCKMFGTPVMGSTTWLYTFERYSHIGTVTLDRSTVPKQNEQGTAIASPVLAVSGRPWSDSRKRVNHKACWVVKVKGPGEIGIPDEMNIAMIVEFEYSFQAEVKVILDIPLYKKLLALPWSKDDPVLFPLQESEPLVGEGLRTTQFETLTDEDWSNLILGYKGVRVAREEPSPSNTPIPIGSIPRTLRIRGIPAEYDHNNISELFLRLFGLTRDEYDIEVCSLINDVERPEHKVATVESPFLEASLPKDKQRQEKAFIYSPQNKSSFVGKHYVSIDTHFYNFTPLALAKEENQYAFDIIALSGLGGHSFGSFKERNGSHMWLRDDLSRDFPHARVLTYGYDLRLEDSRSFPDLEALASTLRTALKVSRRSLRRDERPSDKPIIFIAHSLGGIVLKQVLIQMADGDERDISLCRAVKGILFFGVPSQGMDIRSLLPMVEGNVNEPFLHSLRSDSEVLRNQHREFCVKFPYETCKIVSFFETEHSPTARKGPSGWKMDGEPALLVGPASATLGSRAWEIGPNYSHPIKRDHSNMVKFRPGDEVYSVVRAVLEDLSQGIIQLS